MGKWCAILVAVWAVVGGASIMAIGTPWFFIMSVIANVSLLVAVILLVVWAINKLANRKAHNIVNSNVVSDSSNVQQHNRQ